MSKWFFAKYRSPESNVPIGVVVDDDQDLVIAEVYELEGVNNGPLMACAPELLETLCAVHAILIKPTLTSREFGEALGMCAASIKKAEATNVR